MVKSYPLTLVETPFSNHDIVGIYPLDDKIAIVHFAFGYTTQEEYEKDKCTPSYALLDTFSVDFGERKQAHLSYYEPEIFSNNDALCYFENNCFLLNTKKYIGFGQSISKLIQISDTNLVELCDAPSPTQAVYNDKKIYTFENREVYMASAFTMVCRDSTSKNVFWKLKLSAYLYSEIEEKNGILYFGTAGKGGRCYAVYMDDGTILFDYDTGGTERFIWYNENILLADRKGKPVLLNSKTGEELLKIELGEFKLTTDQHILVKDDMLYAVAGLKNEMYAVCADLIFNEQ